MSVTQSCHYCKYRASGIVTGSSTIVKGMFQIFNYCFGNGEGGVPHSVKMWHTTLCQDVAHHPLTWLGKVAVQTIQ